ncbi:hypothetical protein Tco_0061172, partial [Tanacetum coccineum]
KDNKDKSEQNQSKPTRNGKDKTRVQNGSQSKPDQPDTRKGSQ